MIWRPNFVKIYQKDNHSIVLSEDIEKTFDRVVSIFVLDELRDWGGPLPVIKFIYSFQCNRQIRVKIDGHLSQSYNLHNGVPQRSPPSVILFNIYVNSLARSVQSVPGIDFIDIYAKNIFALASGDHNTVSYNIKSKIIFIQNWASLLGAVVPE